jgi:hypothetical protein
MHRPASARLKKSLKKKPCGRPRPQGFGLSRFRVEAPYGRFSRSIIIATPTLIRTEPSVLSTKETIDITIHSHPRATSNTT